MQTTAAAQSSHVNPPPKAEPQKRIAGGDFETFLKMLTAQIKNQDPLNPMEGSDFAVQLATFSGVEQQVQTNALLTKLAARDGDDLVRYAGFVGKQIRTTGPVQFADKPLIMELSPDPGADRHRIVVIDSFGEQVANDDIGDASGLIRWNGTLIDSQPLAHGTYRFRLDSYSGETLLSTTEVPVYSTAMEVRRDNGEIFFVLEGGVRAGLENIMGLSVGTS
ncbi:flagellar hook capping FlgD N-terminal domain-containing protein [Paracoccus aerodenitrificans]|uniref:flagellar hook capping FlgD N-terminal domain-containing protein n=1 Tax=Paracoccus aerodenitrificans TaxID=3017781 RepID=UPI0022F0B297|nr:flagellar hook capping FlgD N-terminal domain-containing protein [Paracoccus aerodenitrificans]WBU63431.1 hypothetical protein PAE61_13855 [Paracoccus aerodenitrificans]